jgi:catechol 2,3-dioxygenase-like lactoylglutathione lyase family enzyme
MITDLEIHASLAAADVARAKRWYDEKLGWQPVMEMPGLLVYRVGPSVFTIYASAYAGTAQNTVALLEVADVPAEVARLRSRGVVFEEYDFDDYKTVDGVMTDPDGNKNAWFKDSEGNIVDVLAVPGSSRPTQISAMLAASDLDRAKTWYRQKLGFTPVSEFEGVILNYKSGPSSFNVYKTSFAGTAKNTVAGWRVKDVRAAVAELRGRGVVFNDYDMDDIQTVDGIAEDEDGNQIAWFTDSEGNILALTLDRGELAG